MMYAALSEEAAAATADAVRAWSDLMMAWSALATTPTPDGALERWSALLEAGARAQQASARAAALAGAGARFAATPFGVTGMFAAAPPPASGAAAASPGASAQAAARTTMNSGFQSLAKPLGRADDLTRIKGVGEKMQAKLNALGVFHFWQLASMSKDAAARLDTALSAGGRVARDSWIAQARRLAEDVPA
jgi:predicted flap endonuclease-1-like 5' DNA nuclease